MPTLVPALVTTSASGPFQVGTVERRDPGPADIEIDIAYAGICHSDIHTAREEWGPAHFPLTPGHEIAGTVVATGSDVTRFQVGDRVGVGCFVDSCRECENCLAGEEQFCARGAVFTYNSRDHAGGITQGGYARRIVVDENYAVGIPDAIPLDAAAPLLCAGITLYSPLKRWGAGPGMKVGIVGMGGLGHMGVKIAAALGAEVTVLSQSLSKKDDGLRFGASDYYATSDPDTFRTLRGSFDLLVCTVSADVDIDAYLGLLKTGGAMVWVGLPERAQSVRIGTLTSQRRILAGSNIGGIRETQEMLDFCAANGIAAEIETIGADEVDSAWDRVVASDVRYRFVIDTATLPAVG
jgi:alcohol dehydrogenase (NADP+)